MNTPNSTNESELLNNVDGDNFDISELADIKGDTIEEKLKNLEQEVTSKMEIPLDLLNVDEIISNIKIVGTICQHGDKNDKSK